MDRKRLKRELRKRKSWIHYYATAVGLCALLVAETPFQTVRSYVYIALLVIFIARMIWNTNRMANIRARLTSRPDNTQGL